MFDVRMEDRPLVRAIEARVAEIAGQMNVLHGELAVLVAEYRSMGGCGDLSPPRSPSGSRTCPSRSGR